MAELVLNVHDTTGAVLNVVDGTAITHRVLRGPVEVTGGGGGTTMPAGTAGQVPQVQSGSTYVLVTPNTPNGLLRLDGDGTIPDNRIPSSIARDSEVTSAIASARTAWPVTIRVPFPVSALGGSITSGVATIAAFSSTPSGALIWLLGQSSSADDGIYRSAGGGVFNFVENPVAAAGAGRLLGVAVDLRLSPPTGSLWRIDVVSGVPVATDVLGGLAVLETSAAAAEDAAAAAAGTARGNAEAIALVPRHGARVEFPGDTVGRLSTPSLGDVFTAGYEVRSVICPTFRTDSSRYWEFATQSDDGTGSIDNHEAALFRGDPAFDFDEDALYLFFEAVQDGESSEITNRLNGRLSTTWGQWVEVMVRVDFGTGTVTGWERVTYERDDGSTYVTSSVDGAVFRKVAEVIDAQYDSINSSVYDWWIGNTFLGAWARTVWRDGPDGDLVDDVRATDITPGETSFTSTGGNPWTVGAGAVVVADVEDRVVALESAPAKVPTTRTLAGLDLSADRSAADLRTALGQGGTVVSDQTFASSTASVQVNIPAGTTRIRFRFAGLSTRTAASDALRMTINSNTTDSIYSAQAGVAISAGLQLSNEMPGSQTNTDRAGVVEGVLHLLPGKRPSGTSTATSHLSTATASGNGRVFGLEIGSTVAVTTVEFFFFAGSIAAGSRLTVIAE